MTRARRLTRCLWTLPVFLLAFSFGTFSVSAQISPTPAASPAPAPSPAEEDFQQALLNWQNWARTQPAAYADYLEGFRDKFQDKVLSLPGEIPLVTHEGVAALDDAITALRATPPVGMLAFEKSLAVVACELAEDQSKNGGTGHVGSNGSTMFDRFQAVGAPQGQFGENASYGPETPERIIFSLIVDDGVPDRGHRKNILNPAFQLAGACLRPQKEWGTVCVIDYAQSFVPK